MTTRKRRKAERPARRRVAEPPKWLENGPCPHCEHDNPMPPGQRCCVCGTLFRDRLPTADPEVHRGGS